MNSPHYRPEVCTLANGRIAIFVGAAYRELDRKAATQLRDKLTAELVRADGSTSHGLASLVRIYKVAVVNAISEMVGMNGTPNGHQLDASIDVGIAAVVAAITQDHQHE